MTVCGAHTRQQGARCGRPAGWGTEHVGNGRCKLHGGASAGAPVRHGRYSLTHRAGLAEKVERFLDDPAPGDLTAELALLRALLQDYLERFGEHQALRAEDIQFLAGLIRKVGAMVERVARILNQSALTAAEVQFLTARVADLVVQYIAEPDAQRGFLDELRAAVGPGRRALGAGPRLDDDR